VVIKTNKETKAHEESGDTIPSRRAKLWLH